MEHLTSIYIRYENQPTVIFTRNHEYKIRKMEYASDLIRLERIINTYPHRVGVWFSGLTVYIALGDD